MKLTRLLFASLFLAVSISSAQAQSSLGSQNQVYRLKTQFRGEGEGLTADPMTSAGHNSTTFMTPVSNTLFQHWFIVADRDKEGKRLGTYMLYNRKADFGHPLSVQETTGLVKLEPSSNVTGQHWKIEEAHDGYFRLKAMYKGTEHCLEGNQAKGEMHFGKAFMNPCTNEGGQLWKMELVQSK